MKTLDEIKQLMAAGETAEADKALTELLAKEPGNLQAKMLYGTCRQLLGDEETFKRIHDELVPELTARKAGAPPEMDSQWKAYHRLFVELTQDSLERKSNEVGLLTLYGGVPCDEIGRGDDGNTRPLQLYGGSLEEILKLRNELNKRRKKRRCVILGIVLTAFLFYLAWYLGKIL